MTMRRLFLIAAFAAAFATPVSAQSWQDMFKSAIQSLTGGTSSESAAATAAPEPLPEKELFGSWSYQAPAMEYTGDDMLASLATSTLKGQLPSYFQQAGLQPGKATVSFSRRGVFKAVLDTYKVEGVYRYDEDTGELTVECLLRRQSGLFYRPGETCRRRADAAFRSECRARFAARFVAAVCAESEVAADRRDSGTLSRRDAGRRVEAAVAQGE